MRKVRLATRGSRLAVTQANIVKGKLEALGIEAELVIIKTRGDKDVTSPLRSIGGSGLFVKEIERALLDGSADAAVHSGKDLPYVLGEGLVIASNPSVEDARDCLVTRKGETLPESFVIGTGSERRIAQLRKLYPCAEFKEIRGNADTRVKKLLGGEYDAVCLAMAGLKRLEMKTDDIDITPISTDDCIPAACQGMIAVECRADDKELIGLLQDITDREAETRFTIERKLFCSLQADCSMAVGINAKLQDDDNVRLNVLYGDRKTIRRCALKEVDKAIDDIVSELAKGRVFLIGAGSTAGHITVQALSILRQADCIVYDDLIDTEILHEAKPNARLIYVGKRYEKHSKSQEEINAILVGEGKKPQTVVRLKGGDSFVFGRGGEEVIALQNADIPYQVLPGICSGIAVPGAMGIPVTHRGVAQSVTFITGHTATDKDEDYEALSKLNGTLVFFMSLHEAKSIAKRLVGYGKDADTPVSILSNGFGAKEKRIDGRLGDMAELAEKAQTPALIVVGEVAGFHMEATMELPLKGVSVIATGTEHFSKKLADILRGMGAHVIRIPVIEIIPTEENIPEDLSGYSHIAFTSANGIRVFFEHIKKNGIDFRTFSDIRFACIGSGTRDVLAEYGFNADFIPSEYTAEVMGRELSGLLKSEGKEAGLLILRAENGSRKLNAELDKAGICYNDCHIYKTGKAGRLTEWGDAPAADYIVFGSAMGVRAYLEKYSIHPESRVVCIGENTADELAKNSISVIISSRHTAEDIARIIADDVKKEAK